MKRLTEAWFEFKGIRSDDMGIMLKQMPVRSIPGRALTRRTVAGRHGSLTYGEDTYKDVKVRLECDARDETKITAILAWLTGDGLLRFSDEPTLAYEASVIDEYSRSSIQPRMSGQRFTITWTCQPFRLFYPEPEKLIFTQEGSFDNPGTAPALPKIEIRGSGDFSVSIGMQTVYFRDVKGGGIIIDSELGDALNLEEDQLANECMDGPLFKIQPGFNGITWLEGGMDDEGATKPGTITAILITPRWRCI